MLARSGSMRARFLRAGLIRAAVVLGACGAFPAQAVTVFHDQFATRPDNQDVFNTAPTTAGPGVGTYGAILTFPFGSRVDPFTSLGKTLKFNTSSGADPQMLYLPAPTNLAGQNFTMRMRAAYDTFNNDGFNNFAFGFAKFNLGTGANIFSDHVLVQNNQIQLNFAGTDTTAPVPFSFTAMTYYDFVLSYDASKAGVAGQQPFTLAINGADVPLPVSPTTVYQPLGFVDYAAFGGRFSNGLTTRYISDFAFNVVVPEPTTIALVGVVGMISRRRR